MRRFSPRVQTHFNDYSAPGCKTDQAGKNDADINRIVKRFETSGTLPLGNTMEKRYGFASSENFADAARNVAAYRSQFEELPDSLKEKFNGNADSFIQALSDPEQIKALQSIGILPKTPEMNSQALDIVESTPLPTEQEAKQPETPKTETS